MPRLLRIPVILASAAAFVIACSDDDTTNSVPDEGVTLSVSNAAISAPAGTPASTTIMVTRIGSFNGAVTLTATGMPDGVTAAFVPTFVADTGKTSTLTFSSPGTQPAGTSTITVTGSGTGVSSSTVQVQFTVTTPLTAIRR